MAEARHAAGVAEYEAATISRTSRAIRDRPVAALKMAVLRAMPLPAGMVPCVWSPGSAPAARVAVVSAATGALSYGPPRASSPWPLPVYGPHPTADAADPARRARAPG